MEGIILTSGLISLPNSFVVEDGDKQKLATISASEIAFGALVLSLAATTGYKMKGKKAKWKFVPN